MNGAVRAAALPATTVLRLTSNRPLKPTIDCRSGEVILAAVTHPPRIGEARPIAALMPEVLARYGLADEGSANQPADATVVDLLA